MQLLMRVVHPPTKYCLALSSRKVLSDDWSCLIWMGFYKLTRCSAASSLVTFFLTNERHSSTRHPDSCQAISVFYWLIMARLNKVVQVAARSFSCEQLGDSFLDRWEMLCIPSLKKSSDCCQADLKFIEWWLIMFQLNVIVWVAARSFSCQQLGDFFSTDERCLFFHLSTKSLSWQLSSSFEFYWLMTERVSFEWDFTFRSSVVSSSVNFCRQIEVCLFFILHITSWQLASTSEGIDWWLMILCLDEVTQAATRSWLQAIWWHWLIDKLCLPSCKSSPQVVKVVRLK